MSEGQPVDAKVHYEVRIQPGPIKLGVEGYLHEFDQGGVALVRVVVMGDIIVAEAVVGIIESFEVGKMISFVRQGGRLRLGNGLK